MGGGSATPKTVLAIPQREGANQHGRHDVTEKGKTMKRMTKLGVAVLAVCGLAAMGCTNDDNPSGTPGKGGSGSGGSGSGGSGSGGSGSGGKGSGGSGSGGKGSGGSGSGGSQSGGSGSGGSAAGGGSGTSPGGCGTTDGTYQENTTFDKDGVTAPYKGNAWGTWGDAEPAATQTKTGPSGLDCSSGCAMLTVDFAKDTAQYSGAQFVEYFGSGADSVENLLNETITAKVALTVEKASGATTDVPMTISLYGQDTYKGDGTDNAWMYGLGSAASLDAASGWHTVTYKVQDASVPSWAPKRTVCASALHDMGIQIQNDKAIDDTNGAVVTLYVQSITVAPGGSSTGSGGAGGGSGGATGSSGGATGSSGGASGSSGGASGGGVDGGDGGATGSSGGASGSSGGASGSSGGASGSSGGASGSSGGASGSSGGASGSSGGASGSSGGASGTGGSAS
jgi:hypothetical protein